MAVYADKLQPGDSIRVVAPSRSLSYVWQEMQDSALEFLTAQGFKVTFSSNCREVDEFNSSSVRSRVDDLHEAFLDPDVKAVLTCLGGFNANQLLEHIDFDLIASHPKILCGYSDITALLNSIYHKTGLVTYHGPHFSSFGFEQNREYTYSAFVECVMRDEMYRILPSPEANAYSVIQAGACEGTIVGGNLCTLNLLQGTEYMPDLTDKILFLEDDNIVGRFFTAEFDRNLQSLMHIPGAKSIKGLVLGRFEESCGMSPEVVRRIITGKVSERIPVIFNVDFGHVFPFASFPIGGAARIDAHGDDVTIDIVKH